LVCGGLFKLVEKDTQTGVKETLTIGYDLKM